MDVGVTRFLRALTQFVMNVFLLFMIAGQLGMDSASIVAVLGAAGLALSLALQQSLGNFAGGLLILIMKPFRVGDYIISPSGKCQIIRNLRHSRRQKQPPSITSAIPRVKKTFY